jgi:DNA-binding CsgD family transcriptional regulator
MESRSTRAEHLKELLSRDYGWSPRQRQVLDLMTRGRSNQEIADELGVSLDGAKWHVREIFAKLGVDSRDEAAEYWRARNGLRLRFSRLARALVPGTAWAKAVLGTATLAGFGLATALVVVALQTGNTAPAADNDSAAPASATATAAPSPSVQATPATVTGLFEDPRPTNARQVELPPAPPSPFKDWDGVSTVIYDTQTLKETNLGPGGLPSFSPDSTRVVWVAGDSATSGGDGEVRVIDLNTGAISTLGTSRFAQFLDNDTVGMLEPGASNNAISLDLRTGTTTPIAGLSVGALPNSTTPDGYRITWEKGGAKGEIKTLRVIDVSGAVALQTEAFDAVPAGGGHIALQTAVRNGTTNVFLVALKSGEAEFLGTAGIMNQNSRLLANSQRVIWFDNYCSQTNQKAMVFDRGTDEVAAVSLPGTTAFTPDGRLVAASFGGAALLDPATFETTVSIPPAGDIAWSPDYRYAAHGQAGGHDGPCV